MTPEDKKLWELRNTDPFHEAEKITGKSYKDDEPTALLSLMLHMEKSGEFKERAIAAQDTYWSMPWSQYLTILEGLGFELVLRDPYFTAQEDESRKDEWRVYFHPDQKIVLVCNSHTRKEGAEPVTNHAHMSLCVSPKEVIEQVDTWSGELFLGPTKGFQEATSRCSSYWVGRVDDELTLDSRKVLDMDARECLAVRFRSLVENTVPREFPPGECKWFYISNSYEANHKSLEKERISKLPAKVRQVLGME